MIAAKDKKSIIVFFAIIMILALGRSSAQMYFILAFSYLSVAVLWLLNRDFPKLKFVNASSFDILPAIFLFVWLYGVWLGLLLGNDVGYVFSNFAGMVGYFFYYLLVVSNISKDSLYKLTVYIAMFVLLQNVVLSILLFLFDVYIYYGENYLIATFFGYFSGGSSTGQTRMLSISQLVVFPLVVLGLGYSINRSLRGEERIRFLRKHYFFLLVMAIYVVIFLPASKGFVLAGCVLFSLTFYVNRAPLGMVNLKRVAMLAFILVALLLVFLLSGYINIITKMFDSDDVANVARFDQLDYLLTDLRFFGNGLGAIVEGSVRNLEKPYGFELTYLNLMHKFGFLSLFVIFVYLYTFKRAITQFRKKNIDKKYILTSIGLMAYTVPSIGNPFLMSCQGVIMHVIALYLLRPEGRSKL